MLAEPAAYPASFEVEDAYTANELFQRNGWTDGLPIVPPTPELVAAFLEQDGLRAEDVVGVEPVRRRRISAAKLAANAVMAGCLPTSLPVVVAIVRAMCEPEFGLHGCSASTGGSAPFTVVNGPVRAALSNNTEERLDAKAEEAARQCLVLLQSPERAR